MGDYVAMAGATLTPSGWVAGVEGFKNLHPGHKWSWGLGDLVTALLGAGLTLTVLHEYPYANGARLFEGMRERPGQRMYPPEGTPALPLMFGVVAQQS